MLGMIITFYETYLHVNCINHLNLLVDTCNKWKVVHCNTVLFVSPVDVNYSVPIDQQVQVD